MRISKFSVQHPAIVGMILIALVLFGCYAVATTNMEFMGDISLPQIYVITVYPGASAEEIEDSVINIMEENFVTLPDFKSMESSASSSVGSVIITFANGVDPYDKINDVRSRVDDLMDDLPSGINKPNVVVGGASMLPIVTFTITPGEDLAAASSYIENTLKPKLTQIEGVSTITVSGAAEPRVDICLKLDELDAKGISPLTVYQIIEHSNFSVPLGTSEYVGRDITVRYDGKYKNIDEIKGLPVGANGDGTIIYLSDIAEVSISEDERDYYITKNGESVIVISICKRSDGNTIKITNSVKKVLSTLESDTGGALSYAMISDDSKLVLSSLRTVIESGISGIIIAIVVILLFLADPKATLVIGLSMPLSIFFTFIGMRIAGISINLLSISGIVVALGSLVDASIVVLDQVYNFYQRDGKERLTVTESIFKGTGLVDKSVLGSNLTTVVVFIPIAMISGIVGTILHDVSITFMISIFASLLVAFVFVPWLLKKFLREDGSRLPHHKTLFLKLMDKVERGYERALGYTLSYPYFVLLTAVLVLALTIYTLPQMDTAFIPQTDNNDFYVNIEFPYGYKLEDTRLGMERAERVLNEYIDPSAISTYVVYSGRSSAVFSFSDQTNQGSIHVVLVPVKDREFSIHEAIRGLQYELQASLPDASVNVSNGGFDRLVGYISGGGGYGLKLIGDDESELYEAALSIKDFLEHDEEVIAASIDSNLDDTNAVIRASNRYLSSVGLTSYEAGMTAAILFNGVDVGSYSDRESDKRYNIRLSSDIGSYPVNESTLSRINLTTQAGTRISLSNVSDLEMENELSQINHSDRAKSITISATLTGESAQGVTARVNEFLEKNPLPSSVTTSTGGIGELINDAIPPVLTALIVAIFLVYFVMVIIFERFKQPFLVMLTVPFCVIGVTLSLALFGSTLNLVSIMGVISLSGMLVNNGIIMVDYINQAERREREERLRELGLNTDILNEKEMVGLLPYEVELEMLERNTRTGTSSRLRPILMSSLTTILGVLPMAIARGEGSEVYAPLGQVIMGGLTTAMVITLFIMPVFYYLSEKAKIKKIYKRKGERQIK